MSSFNKEIPVSSEALLNGIIDHWDVWTAHDFVLRLAREWGYESFTTELATKLFQQAGYEVQVTSEEEEEEPDATAPQGAASGGWIPWSGEECPVSGDKGVIVRLRDGYESIEVLSANHWDWCWYGEYPDGDIIAYKVVD